MTTFEVKSLFASVDCDQCGINFYVPLGFQKAQVALGKRGGFYCPNGHNLAYTESTADKMRRERDTLAQQIAQRDDEIRQQRSRAEYAERRVSAARGQVTKLKNRAANGVCPCCNRTFSDLQRHMASKHPAFTTEPDATEHLH